ncbi:MAG: Alpha-1,4-glucan:maltose-1-phosphate maltosyltransferase [Candidatus Heimdallarchaeota archaeon LC_3]|nr:MAG: Alpha-1,4-glucan:maltose-1-phosphate maltosyltransferase [Candidatus Heimdallarchaeota archaeon LC_3]
MNLNNPNGNSSQKRKEILDINEFIISKKSIDKLGLNYVLDEKNSIEYINLARNVLKNLYEKPDLYPEVDNPIYASDLNAIWIMKKVYSKLIDNTIISKEESFLDKFTDWYSKNTSSKDLENFYLDFLSEFPPQEFQKAEQISKSQLQKYIDLSDNKKRLLEEGILLWLISNNPATYLYKNILGYNIVNEKGIISKFVSELIRYIENDSNLSIENQNLINFLSTPSRTSLTNIKTQLEFIIDHWSHLLGSDINEVLIALDILNEEEKSLKMGGLGPGPTQILDFSGVSDVEYEGFSTDLDWMPNVLLLAKTAYVWLYQLSKKYNQNITRLDQIPNEELDEIAERGFNALWLIGVWERSEASKKIKHSFGSIHAVASAYSLFDYIIANDLGGEKGLRNLKYRAMQRGIRLAGDMVPNHTGIDSRWVREHPDWFISLDSSPYPAYSFNGQNLSSSLDIEVYIEDHYYSKSDAAVVFKRVDKHTGGVKYIYHGNDGTSMPWNDTAQLNYLKSEVREAIINNILRVADMFPIIRFDAAMTLTRRNFQRLWFPESGSGGAIPSRSENTISTSEFNSLMPNEFWREVVDIIRSERPNTLLLAEAFWLLEGYFVRTLGMHRVYNSAFMNMLKNEENEKFRATIINTLEFSPEILKRFVNFMNNPDEETAVTQFGKGDKYFGICILLSTLPGLPMFGHGQIEGLNEKYGMEFRQPFQEETPDGPFIDYHNRIIFPLLRKRYLYSEVKNFVFYNVYDQFNTVNNDVIAYSNSIGEEKSLIVYFNKFEDSVGRIKNSWNNEKSLASVININQGKSNYIIFKDQITNLEYIRKNNDLIDNGLTILMKPYGHHVFTAFYEVTDNENNDYKEIFIELNGKGTESIEKLKEKRNKNIKDEKST